VDTKKREKVTMLIKLLRNIKFCKKKHRNVTSFVGTVLTLWP